MAVVNIPAKYIFELTNEKVIDNEIDNVEVDAKRIEETKDYSVNVYNNDFDVVTYQQGAETSDIHEEYRLHTQAPTSYCAVSGVFKPFYVDIDVVVNKQIGNKIITQIKMGEDKTDETANIKYSTACIKKSAPISATYNTSESGRHDPSFTNIQYKYPDDGEEGVFNLPKTITVQHNYSDISLSEITVNLNDETNLKDIGGTIKITETNDYFSFRCHLLCGEEIYELKGDAVGPPTNRSTASGTATIYIPQKISLTVYGNTIGIDIKDETVKVGTGEHYYSFSGNELIQKTNEPTREEAYSRLIGYWVDGKETATIRCGIEDFSGSSGLAISKRKENGLPMTIHVGDIVRPYVPSTTGQDNQEPMAYQLAAQFGNADLAKSFIVIAEKIINNGQIFQELSVIENVEKLRCRIEIIDKYYDLEIVLIFKVVSGYLGQTDHIECIIPVEDTYQRFYVRFHYRGENQGHPAGYYTSTSLSDVLFTQFAGYNKQYIAEYTPNS